jgi:hypothetical protein
MLLDMEAKLDIFTYAPRDVRPLLILAIRPSDLSNACKMNKMISKYCGSVGFLIDYLERWHDIEGEEKEHLEDILYGIHPVKLLEICRISGETLPFCSDEKFLKKYADTWEETKPKEYRKLGIIFTKALKGRDLHTLRNISDFYFYNPYITERVDRTTSDFSLFDEAVERGDIDIFEIISKGRGTQLFFEADVKRAQDREDIGVAVAIFEAAKRGDIVFLKALLEEKRVDPTVVQNSKAIIVAAKGGHVEAVKMLMDISPDDMKEIALKEAKKSGREDVVELLEPKKIKSPVDPMGIAARKYVEKLGEYHKEFAESYMEK